MTLFYDFGKFCKKKCLTDLVKFFILASMIFCVVGCNLDTVTEEKNTTGTIQKNTTGTIQGTVIYDNATVSDYSGIQVSLFSSNGLMASNNCISRTIVTKSRSLESVGITNSKGEYIFENVPEGLYTIYASSNSSSQKAVATNVVVRASETVTPDVLGLTATGSIRGSVNIEGCSMLGVDVFIPGTSFIAKIDGRGEFEISNVPVGWQELYIKQGEAMKQLSIDIWVDVGCVTDIGAVSISSEEWDTAFFIWLGTDYLHPDNPKLHNAYFNIIDGCSYIWNGYSWDLLAKSGVDGDGINWLGSYSDSSEISNPQYLDVYYNTTNHCTYIYDCGWNLFSVSGIDGKDGVDGDGINWLGSFSDSSYISDPQYLDAYYNRTDGCSYIWNGVYWDAFTKQTGNINWLGSYSDSSYISDPKYLDAYYNRTDGCSYIWDGYSWDLLVRAGSNGQDGQDGQNGQGINWLGSYSDSSQIYRPQNLDAYFNTTDGCSYIYVNNGWELLAQKGDTGDNGVSINWLGSFSSANEINNPQHLDAYRNSTDGCSYIYISEGVYTPRWQLLASKGEDGASINWRGSYASSNQISYPQKLDAYYNTIDGCSYIYNGSRWELLAQKGDTGNTGMSIKWKGNCSDLSTISNPQVLDAYYNITDGCSYIYDGNTWHLLARKGTDGATSSGDGSIRWLGSFVDFNEVPNPVAMDAFFNATDGCSYIYNGTEWILLAQAGADGAAGNDGISINWLGSYANTNFIHEPKYLDAYWNTTENCAYIYDGEKWTVLTKGPASGGSGSSDPTIGTEAGANIVGTTLMSWNNPEGCIRIPNGVTDIAEEVFYDNSKITRVIIPSSVVSIGKYAFAECSKLTSVEFLGPGLEIIGEGAFKECENLAYITLPNTTKVIGDYAFQWNAMASVNIPDSVISLGKEIYNGCSMLRNLTIGSGLTELKYRTFYNCDSLVSVVIPDTVISINNTVFTGCNNISELQITAGTWKLSGVNSGSATNLTIDDLQYDNYQYSSTWTRDTN